MGNMSAIDAYTPTFDPFGAHTSIPQESVNTVTTVQGATQALSKVLGSPYVWVSVGVALLFLIK